MACFCLIASFNSPTSMELLATMDLEPAVGNHSVPCKRNEMINQKSYFRFTAYTSVFPIAPMSGSISASFAAISCMQSSSNLKSDAPYLLTWCQKSRAVIVPRFSFFYKYWCIAWEICMLIWFILQTYCLSIFPCDLRFYQSIISTKQVSI